MNEHVFKYYTLNVNFATLLFSIKYTHVYMKYVHKHEQIYVYISRNEYFRLIILRYLNFIAFPAYEYPRIISRIIIEQNV